MSVHSRQKRATRSSEARTVGALASHLERRGLDEGLDVRDIFQTLLAIERMSDAEVAAQIGGGDS